MLLTMDCFQKNILKRKNRRTTMPNNKPDKPTIIISCILLVIVAILFYSCSHIEPDHNDGKCDICGKKATYFSKGKEEWYYKQIMDK